MKYASFYRRFASYIIDTIIFLPFAVFFYYGQKESRIFNIYFQYIILSIGLYYCIFLVFKYGGTPGKLLLKIKIAMIDGSPITLRAAYLRYSITFILSFLSSIAVTIAILKISNDQYALLDLKGRNLLINELAPSWYNSLEILTNVWIFSEFITMFFNKTRRSIHDYMAGTVVIMR
jgi:uncharacterized RDD family membrane protein YckC